MTFCKVMLDVAEADNQEKEHPFRKSYHIICDVSKG